MISFDEASALLAEIAAPLGLETLPLAAAHGRILAGPVVARIDSPRADVSAMDGYAVRAADIAGGAALPVIGRSYPGQPFADDMPPHACVRIFTGAALPAGADRIVIQEEVSETDGIATFGPPSGPTFVRPRGSDFVIGRELLAAGTKLTPGALLAIGGGDVGEVRVWRRPRVGLLVTGDELVAPGTAAAHPAAIPDSVSLAVAALAADWGGEVVRIERLADDLPSAVAAAGRMLEEVDVLVVTGGASVGERDHAKAMVAPHGLELLFSKVAMKPGKPVWAGRAGGAIVLGLPGNPTSALVCARLFLAPLLCGMTGRPPAEALAARNLPLAEAVAPVGPRETFFRGREDGGRVVLADHQDSNGQRVPGSADLLVRLPAGDVANPAGTLVPVLTL